MKKLLFLFLCLAWGLSSGLAASKPNVVIVITDDQGYGDLGFNGNANIKTPNIDRLSEESIHLENYHVDPTCAPTRSALLTGRYSNRVGVWHTIQGRNFLRSREITMADIFADNGYVTGLFGKWHLGDNYPYRPEDRGFQHVVYHGAGGIAQAPDYWGNDYFDDTYIKNGKFERFEGFCTDVWFDEALTFIRKNAEAGKPFLAYISPNAPHGPFYCPSEYADIYTGKPGVPQAEFYGMITNIDDNMARLVKTIDEEGIRDNTILIYTTDNGTSAGTWGGNGFNAGMRGSKGSQYDGGHRVPFIMRWPSGNIPAGKKIDRLTVHMDILPTLIELCELDAPSIEFDGRSLKPLIYGDDPDWPDRTLIVESQRVVDPVKWRMSAVMTDRWRLIDGKALFDILADPGQQKDLSQQYPEVVAHLRAEYDLFWDDVSQEHDLTSYIVVGSKEAPVVALNSHDWLVEEVPWNQPYVMWGAFAKPAEWQLEVDRAGEYEISLRRWPVETDLAINDANGYTGFDFHTAHLNLEGDKQSKPISANASEVTFRTHLDKGILRFAPLFVGETEQSTPYYVYIAYEPEDGWQSAEGMNIPRFDPDYGRRPPQTMAQDTERYQKFAR
ncbi:MAG: arylsulfatase [Verrucomicrobiota bacterium]